MATNPQPYALKPAVGSWRLVRLSRHQDTNGKQDATAKSRRYAAAFIVVFGVTISLASCDWIMSLEPRWYSTIFGGYDFSGLFHGAPGVITLLVMALRRNGPLGGIVTGSHLHNLGKLIFTFSTFWMYIWFSQYLLIWYANIPEEVVYFIRRQQVSWMVLTVINLLFNWVIPFIVLLPQWTKKSETVLTRVCIILIIVRWVDLSWMILPPFMPGTAAFGIWEAAPVFGALNGFLYLVSTMLANGNLVPLRDPKLFESLHQHS